MHPDVASVLLDAKTIAAKVAELGETINKDYSDLVETHEDFLVIGILKGAVMFTADLVRRINLPCSLDFVATSSYGKAAESTGAVRILKDLDEPIEGRHVLLVEDIVDTGLTLAYLMENLRSRRPASLRICALLDKPSRRETEVPLDYRGFVIPDEFVVGYGLDFAEKYRNLPYIGILKKEVYASTL